MTSCRLCGHESHCGRELFKDVDNSGNEIKVCYACLCELCDETKINISELLRKHRAGKSIGSTNRARLVARGLIARKSGPHKGKKKDLGKRGKS